MSVRLQDISFMLMPKELDLMHPCGSHIAKGLSELDVNGSGSIMLT